MENVEHVEKLLLWVVYVRMLYTALNSLIEILVLGLCVGLSEMVTETASSPGPFRNAQMSKAAQTHKLRKLRAPSKCRECDSLVVFHGAECEEVSGAWTWSPRALFY